MFPYSFLLLILCFNWLHSRVSIGSFSLLLSISFCSVPLFYLLCNLKFQQGEKLTRFCEGNLCVLKYGQVYLT